VISDQAMRISFGALASLCAFILVKSEIIQKNDRLLEFIANAGYDGEVHKVLTEDGYFLRVHRLSAKSKSVVKRQPVFLMHGILATAADFLITGPDKALGFLLADHGYDVWLGNARGSRFSTKHQNFSKLSNEFWTFSWHEIGFYDLPAMIDYMLEVSGSPNAFFAGHSQGTTALLVTLSTRPEYNQKIIQAHLMAPSAYRKKVPQSKTVLYGLRYLVRNFLTVNKVARNT
jgi:lysosomal acid lipase/cholesteryl ester hydrolase